MYFEELVLIKQTPVIDEIGNITYQETMTTTYGRKNKVGSREFYNAVAVGITPTAELQIKLSNYNDEKEAIYNGVRYFIVRTVPSNDRMDIVLVLGEKHG